MRRKTTIYLLIYFTYLYRFSTLGVYVVFDYFVTGAINSKPSSDDDIAGVTNNDTRITMTYVPSHLYHMLFEIFKVVTSILYLNESNSSVSC